MADTETQELGIMAKLVVAFFLLLLAVGLIWHGVTAETFRRIWHNMVDRPSGPKAFRFILQPSMAAIIGVRDGVNDVRRG